MGHHYCCRERKVKRGLWSPEEDEKLLKYITTYGHGCWRKVPEQAGLERCGKSCRLRWLNYLRPDIKRGGFTTDEEKLIIKLHGIVGNRWSHISKCLPGRTDNEIKNYWNSWIKKKLEKPVITSNDHHQQQQQLQYSQMMYPNQNIAQDHFVNQTRPYACPPFLLEATSLDTHANKSSINVQVCHQQFPLEVNSNNLVAWILDQHDVQPLGDSAAPFTGMDESLLMSSIIGSSSATTPYNANNEGGNVISSMECLHDLHSCWNSSSVEEQHGGKGIVVPSSTMARMGANMISSSLPSDLGNSFQA